MLIAAVSVLVFGLDYVTKWLVNTRMFPGQSIPLIPHVLDITYIRNAGAAFGLLQHQTLFFVLVTVAVVALILTYGRRMARGSPLLALALGLQLGGAVGNLLDRVLYGNVIDFINFRVWPVFNVADSAIVVGGLLFAWILLRQSDTSDQPAGRA